MNLLSIIIPVLLFALILVQWLFHIPPSVKNDKPKVPRSILPPCLSCSTVILLFLAVLCFCTSPAAQAQTVSTVTGSFTNSVTLATNALLNVNGTITMRQNTGIALYVSQVAGGATTSNVTYTYDVSPDGTNWTTGAFTWILALNGTTGVRSYTNIPPSVLNNARQFRLSSILNAASATCIVTNAAWSVSSLGRN